GRLRWKVDRTVLADRTQLEHAVMVPEEGLVRYDIHPTIAATARVALTRRPPRSSLMRGRRARTRETSDRVLARLTGPHMDGACYLRDPDLRVADLAGAGRVGDDVGDLVGQRRVAEDVDSNLRQEVDLVLGAPVHLGVTTLATEALYVRDRHSGDA